MNPTLRSMLSLALPSALLALSACAKAPAPPVDGPPVDGPALEANGRTSDAEADDRAEAERPAALDEAQAAVGAATAARVAREEHAEAKVVTEDVDVAVAHPSPPPPPAEPLADVVVRADAPRRSPTVAPGRAPAPTAKPQESSEQLSRSSKKKADSQAATGAAGLAAPTGGGQLTVAAPPVKPAEVPVLVVDQRSTSEEYTDHGVNPYTLAANDPQSTFSIDVDTAAYTIARRKLNEGALPPEAAVRVEEFINFFDYPSYTAPKDQPFAVHMEAMPDPFRPGHHTLRVGVKGKELGPAERKPLHVTFLVDVSGSMTSADKLPLVKESMHMLVDGLNEEDTVAIATYAGQTARILEPTRAMNKRQIHDAINRLGAGGSTAMSAGIDLAYGMAMESFRPGHENRVVILSDGDANVGASSWDGLLAQIKQYADKGVTLSTVGYGMGNYRDTLMEQLANKGDGNNFYIDTRAQAQRVFVEELGASMLTIARDVKIQVEFNPAAVSAYRLVGYENRDIADKDFRNDRVDAGEVGAGHDVTAVYDVILKDGYQSELATVRMRWEAPGADKAAQEQAWAFLPSAIKKADAQASKDTRIAYAAATFAEVLRGAPTASEISMDALIRYARAAARPGEKDDQELIALMEKARALGAGERGQALSLR